MIESKEINPFDILAYRKKLKQFEQTGTVECMKILKTVREMKLDNKMLKCLEMPRVLLWISRKIGNTEDDNKSKLNKMCRFLFKEWKEQI